MIKLEPGKYWIGDLCYVLNDDEWDEVCDQIHYRPVDTVLLKNGKVLYVMATMYGDGVYQSNTDKMYAVDSGTIGIIKYSDLSKFTDTDESGHVYETEFPFEIDREQKGLLVFGGEIIDTGYSEEYNDYDPLDGDIYDDELPENQF